MLTAQIEELTRSKLDELIPLLSEHYKELSDHFKHGHALNPNYNEYLKRQISGEFIYITLRDNGELIGYHTIFLIPCLHYQLHTFIGDIIFVVNDKRGASGGGLILEVATKEFKRRGFGLYRMGYKVGHAKYMDALLTRFGFVDFEVHKALWA